MSRKPVHYGQVRNVAELPGWRTGGTLGKKEKWVKWTPVSFSLKHPLTCPPSTLSHLMIKYKWNIHFLKRCIFHWYHSSMPLSMTWLCLKGCFPNFHLLCEFLVIFNIHLRKLLLSEPKMPPPLPRDLVTFFLCTPSQGTNISMCFGIRNLS